MQIPDIRLSSHLSGSAPLFSERPFTADEEGAEEEGEGAGGEGLP